MLRIMTNALRVLQTQSTFRESPIADAILAIRRSRGISRTELAERAKMDRSQLWRIETGRAFPQEATLFRIAAALDVTATELLSGDAA